MLSPENEAVVNDIMEQAGMLPEQQGAPAENEPDATPQPDPAAVAAPVPDPVSAPAPDFSAPPQMTPDQLAAILQQQLAPIQQQVQGLQAAQPQPQMTEEEAALAELADRLGIKGIQDENAKLKAQLEEQQKLQEERVQKEANDAFTSDVEAFKEGKNENAVQIVEEALAELAKQSPQLAANFDNPTGWNMIYKSKLADAAPVAQPDPILGSSTPQGAPQGASAFDRAKKGEDVPAIDLGMEILNLSGGGQ